MKLLLHRSLTIDRNAVERVMQAVLFYADSVVIRAGAVAWRGDPWLVRRVNELIDIGAVRTWAYEYELDRRGCVAAAEPGTIVHGRPGTVLSVETSRDMVVEVDEELSSINDSPPTERPDALRQGVAEVVQFRHSMLVFRLTDHLGAAGVITGHSDRSHLLTTIERTVRAADRHDAVVREVIGRCSFGPLADLPLKAIVDCRQETARFGALVDRHLGEASGGHSPRDVARAILFEYAKVRRAGAVRHWQQHAGESVWDVVGAVLPSAVVLKMLGTRVQWFRHRGRSRPFLLLGKLQHHVAQI